MSGRRPKEGEASRRKNMNNTGKETCGEGGEGSSSSSVLTALEKEKEVESSSGCSRYCRQGKENHDGCHSLSILYAFFTSINSFTLHHNLIRWA